MPDLKSLLFGACNPAGNCAQIVYAVYRVAFGLSMALLHGIKKLPPSEGLVGGVENMGFPLPSLFAWGVGLTEFAGALLIALGFLTRPAAMALGVVMLVAFFGAHGGRLAGENNGEMAFLYLLGTALIASLGSGKYGVDARIRS